MAPLRKERVMNEGVNMVQAGRSSTGLAAEKDSARLQSQSTLPSPTQSSGRKKSPRPRVETQSDQEDSHGRSQLLGTQRRDISASRQSRSDSNETQITGASALSLARRTSYVPIIPSPLNPASPQASSPASDSGSDENTIAEGDVSPIDSVVLIESSRRKSTENFPMAAGGKWKCRNLSQAQQILRQKTVPLFRPEKIARAESPKFLSDLGRDYSRYPASRSSSRLPPARAPPVISDSTASSPRSATSSPLRGSQVDLHQYGFPDDSIGTFNPYFGGEKGFILYESEVEADDQWHKPADDDDITYKPHWTEYFDRRQIVSTLGGILLISGLLCIFVVLPVLTFQTNFLVPGRLADVIDYGPAWARVNNRTYPLLKNIRRGLIDPTTPAIARTRNSTFDGSALKLVFSDEFNDENRTFYPGDDPYWTAPDIWYGATQDMEWYDPVAVTTSGGTLQLTLSAVPQHNLGYTSGMLNSWNQLCFKGGVFEVSVSLPGPAGVPGLWPGVWTMGNLGRPGYLATTDGTWPYTYSSCDAGITPNQSAPDGMNFLPGQRLNSCTCQGEDHPNPGTGRGAPEIDVLEASISPANFLGIVTQSAQVAPFDIFWRPNSDFIQIPNYETTQMNSYCGGPYQQAVSGATLLNDDWYDGQAYQKYAFEYVPGTSTGKIAWFVGEDQSFMMDGRAVGPNGNVAARPVSGEPMSMVLNLGLSTAWSAVDLPNLKFPTTMHVDYVRIYQKEGDESVTCDPPGYPTTEYIASHMAAYSNPNLTHWNETGYSWPKNTLTGNCSAAHLS